MAALGCGGESKVEPEQATETESPSADAGPDAAAQPPLYAMVTHLWSDDGTPTGYVALMDSLDADDISLDDAREFPGYTSVGVADGLLLVNPSAEDPTIERYRINTAFNWTSAGASVGFANEGVEEVGFYRQYLGKEAAYIDVDVLGRVIWNPYSFELIGAGSDTDLPMQQDGLDLFANFNRTNFTSEGEIMRPFSYHDQDWFRWSEDTKLVIYDATTHAQKKVVTAPCPGLDSITRAEDGNIYLGTWEYSALSPLIGLGKAPCVVRLTPEFEIDESWNTDLTALTGGRQIVNFRYIGKGKAIAAVLHAEEYGEGFDFEGLTERTDDFWALAANYHRLWIFDVENQTAQPVEGIDDFEFINPWFFHSVIDDRAFVFLGEGSSNNSPDTVVFELEDAGRAKRRFSVPGGVIQWLRVR